jgi:cytidylate kinase
MIKKTRTPQEIVEHQVQRWDREHRRHAIHKQQLRAVITVSRQYGALGAHLGRLVADRLGYECWDQEILHEIARHAKAPRTMFESLDERKRNAVSLLIAVFGEKHHITAGDYMRQLLHVLHTIAQHGNAVIVGRGAQYVLEPTTALRVRTVCPLEDRVAGLAKRKGLSEKEAREACERIDRERRDFIRSHYDRDIEDPTGYDLIINTGTCSVDVAADIVISAYRSRFDLQE